MIRMPLKLKLGRTSGRYELSEDIYILTILVGDQTIAQCTLTSHSTSTDVFRFLAEKHCIKQPELFGLQYQMKATDTEKRMMRWVEPDKPIRRQLERWACRRGQKWAVNLAILHACANVFTLHDTISRSIYYTLLKLDVLQGNKFATLELDKCINLAAYQLQIEFPNLNSPTLQHLKMLSLLPQDMCRNPKLNTDDTYARILSAYEKLHTMQPAYAALLYIVEIQQCEGYGEELFPCKDGSSLEEVSLGYSLDFIFVRRPNGTDQKFRWDEVREITAHKRKISIKCGDAGALVVFAFEDNEMARYVSTVFGWKWRHARVDAQQQKAARLSVQNLQGGVPCFSAMGSQLRRSTGNVNSVRPSSELNGIVGANGCAANSSNGTGGSATNGNSFMAPPSLPYTVSPLLPSSTTVVQQQQQQQQQQPLAADPITQSPCFVRTPANVCCRTVSMGQMPATVVPTAQFFLPAAHIPSPNAGDKMSPTAPSLAALTAMPSTAAGTAAAALVAPPTATPAQFTAQQQIRTSNSSQDSDWLRNEQREILKKMLTEKRRLNKIGSSPEINTIGLNKGAAVGKCKRQQQQNHHHHQHQHHQQQQQQQKQHHQQNANNVSPGGTPRALKNGHGSGRRLAGFAMARKIFTSTPNLNSTTAGATTATCRHQQHQLQQNAQLCPAGSKRSGKNGAPGALLASSPLAPVTTNHHHLLNQQHLQQQQQQKQKPNGGITVPLGTQQSLPYYSPPPPLHIHPTLHPSALLFTPQQQNGVANVPPSAQLASLPAPQTFPALFSQGQLIDENGQQRAVIYPIPPEAAASPLIRPSNSPPALISSTSATAADEGATTISRSSPRSNGTSSQHSDTTAPLCVQSSLGSDGSSSHHHQQQQQNANNKNLPEFSELEFSGIPAKSLSADFSVAVRPHNLHRNRGSKIYPYNDSRARLCPTKENPDGYINASNLSVPVGKHTQLRYVVSQAPIAKTIEDFWQLVWETNARLIVMLVNPHQLNKDDTVPSYIPKQAKEKLTVGDFFLRLKSVSPPMQMQFQSTTSFTLSKRGEARRTIWHLYCADFSEQGVPSSMDTFIGLIDAVASVKRHIENEAKQQQQKQSMVTKSNSNASKESSLSVSSDTSKRDRTQSANSENGWTKKLRFESNSDNNSSRVQKKQSFSTSSSCSSTEGDKTVREEPLTIIQCTDGASESGLYLLTEVVIRCMESNATFDIAQLLRDLRYQRMCLVKNASQYKFVYDLATFYERKLRLV